MKQIKAEVIISEGKNLVIIETLETDATPSIYKYSFEVATLKEVLSLIENEINKT
jgi:hypothetical protein